MRTSFNSYKLTPGISCKSSISIKSWKKSFISFSFLAISCVIWSMLKNWFSLTFLTALFNNSNLYSSIGTAFTLVIFSWLIASTSHTESCVWASGKYLSKILLILVTSSIDFLSVWPSNSFNLASYLNLDKWLAATELGRIIICLGFKNIAL